MGKTLTGGIEHEGNVNLLTPQQQQFLSSIMNPQMGGQAGNAYSQFLQPVTPESYNQIFQQSVVDPAMLQYKQQVLPSIQQSLGDLNAGSSSALNQTLAQSANDLTTMLGQQYGNFFQQGQQNQLNALGQLGNFAGQRTFDPILGQSQGILGSLIGLGGQLGSAAIMASSEKVKENIRDYKKGLDVLKDLDVKIYDYIEEFGGGKDKVGVIAEKVPEEIQEDFRGIKGVNLYGLIGLLINSVKELDKKVSKLEKK